MELQTSQLYIRKEDLESDNLFRLNQIIEDLYSKIASTRRDGKFTGTPYLESPVTDVKQGEPRDNQIVPWGTIRKYLSPEAVKQAFVTNNWFGRPVRTTAGTDIPANVTSLVTAVVNTHAVRLANYPAAGLDIGSLYYETDRTSLYQVQLVAGSNTWVWIAGHYQDAYADQPSDLGASDAGFLFTSTTANKNYNWRWDGSAWVILDPIGEDLTALVYDATNYPVAALKRGKGSIGTPSDVATNDSLGDLIFYGFRNSDFRVGAKVDVVVEATPSTSIVSGRIRFFTNDTSGLSYAIRWSITADGNFIPGADLAYNIGSASEQVSKVFAGDLELSNEFKLTNGATNGYVLTSDAAGVGTWQAGAGTANNYKTANSSSTQTLTTSYADITGCSVSLDQDGDWLIVANLTFYKDLNDDECLGQLLVDGVAQTGLLRGGNASLYNLRGTSCRAWVVNVASQPKTAKLQGKKNSGTGTSTSDINNTSITAVFLKP